jgi:hypothetical protein
MSRRTGGRPSNADLQHRANLKAAAAKQDQARAETEAKIAQGEFPIKREKLPDNILEAGIVTSPAVLKLMPDALKRAWLKGASDKQIDEACKSGLPDLLTSDIPMGRDVVKAIGAALKSTPEEARRNKDRLFIERVEMLKQYYAERGLTVPQAEKEIAEAYGWKPKTLHKELQRARNRLRDPAK